MQIQAQALDLYSRIQAAQPVGSAGKVSSRAENSASQKDSGTENGTTASARVTTRTVGFSLGSFGVEYSSSNLHLDESLSAEASQTRQTAQAFTTEAEVESLRAQVAVQAVTSRQSLSDAGNSSDGVKASMQACIAAYAQASSPEMPVPGSMFASMA